MIKISFLHITNRSHSGVFNWCLWRGGGGGAYNQMPFMAKGSANVGGGGLLSGSFQPSVCQIATESPLN